EGSLPLIIVIVKVAIKKMQNFTLEIHVRFYQIKTVEMRGVGYDDSEYIDISSFFPYPWMADPLLPAFKQSGFANQILGKYKLLPCSLGWFVNASSEAKKCIECPAGGFYSDQLAFVNDSCLHCKNGTFVHYNNAPGKSPFDCKTCPD
ncbi:unnamed protein product, partial [Porites evermanni]